MRLPRLSVTALMLGLLILAADLGWLRWYLLVGRRSMFGFYPMALDMGFVPIVSILAVCGYLATMGKRGPFFGGFTGSLSVALVAYLACCLTIPTRLDNALKDLVPVLTSWSGAEYVRWLTRPVEGFVFADRGHFDLWEIAWIAGVLCLPQLIMGLAGGLLFADIYRRRAKDSGI